MFVNPVGAPDATWRGTAISRGMRDDGVGYGGL